MRSTANRSPPKEDIEIRTDGNGIHHRERS